MSQDSSVIESTSDTTDVTAAPNEAVKELDTTQPSSQSSRSAHPLSWINFVLLLVLIGLAGYFGFFTWQQQQLSLSKMAVLENRVTSTESNQSNDNQRYQDLTNATLELSSTVDQLQQQVLFNSDRLAKLPGAERQDWLLAEVEYLLRLANQRLSIERDWNSAISLLTAADNVLVETRNPRFNEIRSQISREILALRAVPTVDKSGTIFKLQSLQESIANLSWAPRAYTQVEDSADVNSAVVENEVVDRAADATALNTAQLDADLAPTEMIWRDIFGPFSWTKLGNYAIERWQATQAYMKSNFDGIVRVRRLQDDMPAPLSPEQQYYLQQNMFLMLEQAQVALLREQENLFQHSIKRVVQWTTDFVIMDNPQTLALLSSLSEIQTWNAAPALPDISQSLTELRRLLEQQRRGSVVANAATAELPQLTESR